MGILDDREIDIEEAQKFLYSDPDIDLLPNLPCRLNAKDAAFILSVSVPTIRRLFDKNLLASDGDGSTSKDSLIEFIERNYQAKRVHRLYRA
ncbi:helix-turn-helix domain-containing protein [Treponema endosymbiont of Eucomonympha sp.]|uniref:helix-turn-helix domain-containing protein n=1 Tax=Treponema endosymbiont of Eucomonympha sp. TaxID=1580831 RepID=UPI0007848A48|nr:helix-turn-helix domain-containing protein [Treponema endosymbiont of Eucomonympha sp.]